MSLEDRSLPKVHSPPDLNAHTSLNKIPPIRVLKPSYHKDSCLIGEDQGLNLEVGNRNTKDLERDSTSDSLQHQDDARVRYQHQGRGPKVPLKDTSFTGCASQKVATAPKTSGQDSLQLPGANTALKTPQLSQKGSKGPGIWTFKANSAISKKRVLDLYDDEDDDTYVIAVNTRGMGEGQALHQHNLSQTRSHIGKADLDMQFLTNKATCKHNSHLSMDLDNLGVDALTYGEPGSQAPRLHRRNSPLVNFGDMPLKSCLRNSGYKIEENKL